MKISVAMCTYNGARYLPEQLESLSAQTRLPDELIVCDDYSTDESVSIVSDFGARASFPVQLHTNQHTLGSTKNFEQAIQLCDGDIIALCDQDDIWLPGKLARVEAEFARASEVGLVFTDAEIVDQDLKLTSQSLWEKLGFGLHERASLLRGEGFDSLLQGATVTGATAAFRSRFKPLLLPIPDNLPLIHDAWITLLVAAVSRVLPVAERLVRYRQHGSQQVGALERVRPLDRIDFNTARAALNRENPYTELLATATAVQRRLREKSGEFNSAKALVGLESRIAHLKVRSELPEEKLHRVSSILSELMSGRYHRYANGFRSAIKDLIA